MENMTLGSEINDFGPNFGVQNRTKFVLGSTRNLSRFGASIYGSFWFNVGIEKEGNTTTVDGIVGWHVSCTCVSRIAQNYYNYSSF